MVRRAVMIKSWFGRDVVDISGVATRGFAATNQGYGYVYRQSVIVPI